MTDTFATVRLIERNKNPSVSDIEAAVDYDIAARDPGATPEALRRLEQEAQYEKWKQEAKDEQARLDRELPDSERDKLVDGGHTPRVGVKLAGKDQTGQQMYGSTWSDIYRDMQRAIRESK